MEILVINPNTTVSTTAVEKINDALHTIKIGPGR